MPSTPLEVRWLQIQCPQFAQIFRPHTSEFIQQLRERLPFTNSYVTLAIKRLKRLSLAKFQHHPCPRHPIRAFTVNQMAHDIECAPCVFPFIFERPRFRQITQKRIESCGGASEKRYGVV